MRNESHNTLIGIIKAAIVEWRKREGWSRETVVQAIVEAHDSLGAPAATGIVFDSPTRDPFERQKNNADRVFRWLDDEAKDTNLLPANFLQSILVAMPMDIRLHCLDTILRPLGVVAHSRDVVPEGEFDTATHLDDMIREGAEAQVALVRIKPGAPVAVLEKARKEVQDVQESTNRVARALEAAINSTRSTVSKLCTRSQN